MTAPQPLPETGEQPEVASPGTFSVHFAWLGLMLSAIGAFGYSAADSFLPAERWADVIKILLLVLSVPGLLISCAALVLENDRKLIAIMGILLGLPGWSAIMYTLAIWWARSQS